MSIQSSVLQNVKLEPQPRRLLRASAELTQSSVAPSDTLAATRETTDSATMLAPRMTDEDRLTATYQEGVREGVRLARAEADKQLKQKAEEMAEQMAVELAKAHIQTARDQAQQQVKTQVEQDVSKFEKKFHRQWIQKLELLAHLLQQIPAQLQSRLDDAEDDMLALVYDVVCRILGEESASLPGLRAHLKRALKSWHGRSALAIHLHHDDLNLLQHDSDSLKLLKAFSFESEQATLRWVADPKVKLGGCMLRSEEGMLDARLEVQLKALEKLLLNTRASRKHLASLEQST